MIQLTPQLQTPGNHIRVYESPADLCDVSFHCESKGWKKISLIFELGLSVCPSPDRRALKVVINCGQFIPANRQLYAAGERGSYTGIIIVA
jgi:hypothetical protein